MTPLDPDIRALRVAAADLNGIPRGKRMPAASAAKVMAEGTRWPFSAMNLDIWGEDIAASPLVFASGDPDGWLRPTERGLLPVPWLDTPTALLTVWMFHEDGRPFDGCARQALARTESRLAARGLTPVIGTELEFYLIDDSGPEPQMPASPRSGKRRPGGEVLSLRTLDAFDGFLTDLYDGCAAMGIPADTAISECGAGQFEITLGHVSGALRAADDAWLFKMLTHGLARRHGLAASFMAKPYAGQAGTGMHVHVSLLGPAGRNVFDNGGPEGTETLHHAIAGALAALVPSTLIFAPHGPSYDRLVPGAHAPFQSSWAYENRTAALRVPGGAPCARRLEHRVAGGDVNPYLMLTAILGAMLTGIEDAAPPPPPITGNAYEDTALPRLPTDWATAIELFSTDATIARIFSPDLIRNLTLTKRQELAQLGELSAEECRDLYLDTV